MTHARPTSRHFPRSAATPRRSPRGLALIEVLICSSICALLLTATGVAFRASMMAYRDNSDRDLLMTHGRIAMRQMINEIRQADIHTPINDATVTNAVTLFAQGQTTENGGIQLLKTQPDGDEPGIVAGNASTYVLITWLYDPNSKSILRLRSVNGSSSQTVAAMYVQEFKVRMEPTRSAANVAAGNTSFDLLLRAVVTINLQNIDSAGNKIFAYGGGQATERIIDAAVPRRNFSGL